MREHLAGVLHQNAEQFVFLGRELNTLGLEFDDPPHQIDREIADTKNRPLAMLLQLMPKRGAHPGQKLIHSEWLGHVIVRAGIERLNLAGFVVTAGQNYDRHTVVARTYGPQELIALHVRQAQIEDDQTRRWPLNNSSAILPLDASRVSYPCAERPTRSNLRIGGSSSITRTRIGAALMLRRPTVAAH